MPKTVKKRVRATVALQEVGTSAPVTKTCEERIADPEETLSRVAGVKSPEVARALATQVINLQVWTRPDPERPLDTLTRATSFLGELGPRNMLEALLVVQMLGVHEAATAFLRQATAEGQTVDGADRTVLRATRLMRLFNEQLVALAKLRGKASQQKVTVEHVHVHEGGQAIVGAVGAPKQG